MAVDIFRVQVLTIEITGCIVLFVFESSIVDAILFDEEMWKLISRKVCICFGRGYESLICSKMNTFEFFSSTSKWWTFLSREFYFSCRSWYVFALWWQEWLVLDGSVVMDQMTCSTSKYCFINHQWFGWIIEQWHIVGLSSLSLHDMSSKRVQWCWWILWPLRLMFYCLPKLLDDSISFGWNIV